MWFTNSSFPGLEVVGILGFECRVKGYQHVAFFTINSLINSAKAELHKKKKNHENKSHKKNLNPRDLCWPVIQNLISECIQIFHCKEH